MAVRRAFVLVRRLALAAGLLAAAGGALAQDLVAALREEIVPVRKPGLVGVDLQTTYFRPPGDGPFPWVIINHGKAAGDPRLQPRARYLPAARELVQRGWAVVVPMRQGFAQSGGVYLNPGCNVHSNGLGQAEDVQVVLEAFRRRPELDPRRVLLWGQSHGGLTTVAAGTLNLPGVLGLVNFAGGLRQESCPAWERQLAEAFGRYGGATHVPALFFYGDNDSYWAPPVWQEMARRYNAEGGQARVVAFGPFGSDAHGLFGSSAGVRIWLPEVERFVRGLDLPFDKQRDIALAEHAAPVPPDSGFAALRDAAALPHLRETGRAGYAAFLAAPQPKAFALSSSGAWSWRADRPDAMKEALANCQTRSPAQPCALYAVDDHVVWPTGETP